MASFFFGETVSIYRQTQPSTAGAVGYEGIQAGQIETVAANIPASVQLQKTIGKNPVDLPGDPMRLGNWLILCQTTVRILDRDIVETTAGRRFVVNSAWNSPMGWQLYCEVLEA